MAPLPNVEFQNAVNFSISGSSWENNAPLKVKFGMEDWTRRPLLPAKFPPDWWGAKGLDEYRPHKNWNLIHFSFFFACRHSSGAGGAATMYFRFVDDVRFVYYDQVYIGDTRMACVQNDSPRDSIVTKSDVYSCLVYCCADTISLSLIGLQYHIGPYWRIRNTH